MQVLILFQVIHFTTPTLPARVATALGSIPEKFYYHYKNYLATISLQRLIQLTGSLLLTY